MSERILSLLRDTRRRGVPESPQSARPTQVTRKARVFWPALAGIVVFDVVTKHLAHTQLRPRHVPREVLGDVLRLTLGYNPGAAFGLYLGEQSRWIFLGLALVILGLLGSLYRKASPGDRLQALALGLLVGGAVGNVVNRVWSAEGVVDFIDVGVGSWRWPTFNVADIGVTTGAVLLAWVLWREDRGVARGDSPTVSRP